LLRRAITKGIEVTYIEQLLSAFVKDPQPIISIGKFSDDYVDSLSERELEVLRLLITDLTTTEIAQELIVSVSTFRTHIKNSYGKLDVHSWHEVITKARESHLL